MKFLYGYTKTCVYNVSHGTYDKEFSTDFSQVCRKLQVYKRAGNFVTH